MDATRNMRRRAFATAAVAAACLAAPALARADWQAVAPPITTAPASALYGYDLKHAGDVVYAAWSESNGQNRVIRVAELDPGSDRWVPVGGVVNDDPSHDATQPSLAIAPNRVPWIAWTERDEHGIPQVRAAHLSTDGERWEQPDARDFAINYLPPSWPEWGRSLFDGSLPSLVFLGARPYIAYRGDNPSEWQLDVVRLGDDRHTWEHVGGGGVAPIPRPGGPRAAVVGGHLWVVQQEFDAAAVGRLDDGGFRKLPDLESVELEGCGATYSAEPAQIVDLNGTAYALWTVDTQDCGREAVVGAFDGTAWNVVGGGAVAQSAYAANLRTIGGRLYAAWADESDPSHLHLSRLADDGQSWIGVPTTGLPADAAPVISSVDGAPYLATASADGLVVYRYDGAPDPLARDDGEGSGPGTDAVVDARPSDPPELGSCGWKIDGTDGSDYIFVDFDRGSVHGFAGADSIYGNDQADCLYGEQGPDQLVGRGGDDRLDGGIGNDKLLGGPGNDTEFGRLGNDVLAGAEGDDLLVGGPGDDTLWGGPGVDVFSAGAGNDTIYARDGVAEDVNCGRGFDRVQADASDRLIGCEKRLP